MPSISKNLSKFNTNEVKAAFKNVKYSKHIGGLKFLLSPHSSDFGKILVIAPKKIGNSPKRNLLRRRIKSIFYENKLYISKYNWIVLTSRESTKTSFEQLKKIIFDIKQNVEQKTK